MQYTRYLKWIGKQAESLYKFLSMMMLQNKIVSIDSG